MVEIETDVQQTKIMFNKIRVIAMTLTAKNGRMNKNQIRKEVLELKDRYKDTKPNVRVQVRLLYDKSINQYRSGRMTTMADRNVYFWNPEDSTSGNYDESVDQESFKHAVIYILPSRQTAGGSNENNDCLFLCLKEIFSNKLCWKSDQEMRKELNINEGKIEVDELPKLQDKLNANIYVSGDENKAFVKEPKRKYFNTIKLELKDGHYSVKQTKSLYNYKIFNNKPIATFKKFNDGKYGFYDGNKLLKLTKPQYHKKYFSYTMVQIPNGKNIKKEYNKYVHNATILSKAINDKLNRKTPYIDLTKMSMSEGALKLFHYLTKSIAEPEYIDMLEAKWLEMANSGAIIYGKKGSYDNAYCYDFNSHYPSIIKTQTRLPIGKPEFIKMKDGDPIGRLGIYRVKIEEGHPFFRYNPYNFYTQTDLKFAANELKLNYNFIDDDEANVMLYTESISFKQLMGEYVNILYELKRKKCPMAKDLLNCLWGVLSKQNIKFYNTIFGEKDFTNLDIYNITPTKDNEHTVKYSYNDQRRYTYNFARLKPFILAFGRIKLLKLIEPIKKDIIRVHTDGFITTKKQSFNLDNKLGGLKLEKSGPCIVYNANKVEFN